MKRSFQRWLVAVSIPLLSAAFPAFGQSCATPAAADLYVDKDSLEASDSGNGRYRADGGTGPFRTIQKLVDTLSAGQCGWVKSASTPYYEVGRKSGQAVAGITITRGGTSESRRLTVSGYPGQTVVIDQQRATPQGSWGASGFNVAGGDYITIRNFEIRNTSASSISFTAVPTRYAVVENNHLHHSYVTENAGGVRLDSCENCIVRNNTIHHHYRTFPGYTSNWFDSEPYGLNAGVHGFGAGNCTIANNLIYNVGNGIYQKQVSLTGLEAHKIYGNIIVNAETAFQIHQGSAQPAARNAEFHHNIVYRSGGIYFGLADTSSQSSGLKIYNNTFVNSAGVAGVSGVTNVEVYNNIVVGTTHLFDSLAGPPVNFSTINGGSWANRITYFDNNLYHATPSVWILERYTGSSSGYDSLAAWRGAQSGVLSGGMSPDSRAIAADPMFVSSAWSDTKLMQGLPDDYALQSGSPAVGRGRSGGNLGAVVPNFRVGLLGHAAPAPAHMPGSPRAIPIGIQ